MMAQIRQQLLAYGSTLEQLSSILATFDQFDLSKRQQEQN